MSSSRTAKRQAPGEPVLDPSLAVSLRDVSKAYRTYAKPSDRLKQAFVRHRRKLYSEHQALRDITFDLPRGSAFGIVGRNGAGKSTLLKIIAGTLTPTTGVVMTRGRVLALLELGSAFSMENTGRENIYLYGASLGLTTEEIHAHYEAIVAFAEIGDYIHLPIKTYSSGMVMRLAFAVQAFIDPTVLIVDEALSVGDLYFQHKCMLHIERLLEKGVTLLFVSHSPDTVKRLCDTAVWLKDGGMEEFGPSGEVVDRYVAAMRMEQATKKPAAVAVPSDEEGNAEREAEAPEVVSDFEPDTSAYPHLETLPVAAPGWFTTSNSWSTRETQVEGRTTHGLYTWEAGAVAGFRFSGSYLELEFMRHPWSGRVQVIVDGEREILDLYQAEGSSTHKFRASLGEGEHTVTLRVEEERHADSRASEVWLLRAVLGEPAAEEYPLLEELNLAAPAWHATHPWEARTASLGIRERHALFNHAPGSMTTFRFEGRYLELEFMRHGWSGRIQVRVDDRTETVDLYTPGGAEAWRLRMPGLSDGTHAVEIANLPERNPASGGHEVWLLGAFWGESDVPFKVDEGFMKRAQESRYGTGEARFTCVELLDAEENPHQTSIPFGARVRVRMHAEIEKTIPDLHISFLVRDRNRLDVFGSTDFDEGVPIRQAGGRLIAEFQFTNNLAPGSYSVLVALCRGESASDMTAVEVVEIAAVFEVPFDKNRPVYYLLHVPVEVVQYL